MARNPIRVDDLGGPAADYGALSVELASVRQQVRSIESSINGLTAQFGALASRVEERSRTPWGTLVSGMALVVVVMTTIGSLAIAPVTSSLVRLQADLDRRATVNEFETFKSNYDGNRQAFRVENEAKLSNLGIRIDKLDQEQVPRGEHEEKWRSADLRFQDLQRQIEEIRKSFGDTFSLRDALLEMKARLDALDAAERARRTGPSSPGS